MAYNGRDNRMSRKDPVGMEQLVREFIREMKISDGMNAHRASEAWNEVSGASRYTLDVTLDRGILYVTMNSSMARNQLYFQRDVLLERINEYLENDALFIKRAGFPAIRNIVLK